MRAEDSSTGRRERARDRLAEGPHGLAAAVCEFAGLGPPRTEAAQTAVLRMIECSLDPVPVGCLGTAQDLWDAATHTTATEPIPPIPASVNDALRTIDELLEDMRPAALRALADELGLTWATATCGALCVASDIGTAQRFGDDYPDTGAGLPDVPDAPTPRWPEGAEQLVDTLAHSDPATWNPTQVAALRAAVRLLMARIGDGYLTVSEWSAPRLDWHTDELGGDLAVFPVPGAPQPLQARIALDRRGDDPAERRLLFRPAELAPYPYSWQVGWCVCAGEFRRYGGGHRASREAARFAAEHTMVSLTAHAGDVRMPLSGELLLPRPPGVRSLDARVIDLGEVLSATLNQQRCERDDSDSSRWRSRPHQVSATELGSTVGALLDQLGVPLPAVGQPSNNADPGSPAFTGFLASHAVTLTPLASRYLAGMAAAGEGEQPLRVRHSAGMRAVLADRGGQAWLPGELPPRHDVQPGELTDIDRLQRYFAGPD